MVLKIPQLLIDDLIQRGILTEELAVEVETMAQEKEMDFSEAIVEHGVIHDDELVKIDTATGKAWRWVSERDRDRKVLREYWQEMVENDIPMAEGGR